MTIHAAITIVAAIVIMPFCMVLAVIWSFYDKSGNGPHRVARFWAVSLLWASGVKVTVHGLENLKPDQPYVLAANHASTFDIFVLLAYIPLQFRWLAKAELFRFPLFGRSMTSCGYIPISRSSPRDWIRSLNGAAQRIKNGASVVVFPEGTRSADGRVMTFKRGGIDLAVRSGQPVVPVSISGAHRVMPSKSLRLTPGPIKIVIGSPMETQNLDRTAQDKLMSVVRETIIHNLDPAY